jgi:hypothetical protein
LFRITGTECGKAHRAEHHEPGEVIPMHRFVKIFGATTLIGVVAACSSNTSPPANPTAAPTDVTSSAATPSDQVSDAPTATRQPPAPSSASPTSPPVEAAHTDPADFTIHPDHIGPLKIGMSLAAAKKTGLIVVEAQDESPFDGGCVGARWKGQSDDVGMVFNGKYGLRALDSFGGQKTPEGIKAGSTLAAVRRAYPHLIWRMDGDEIPESRRTDGDALVDVVKGDGAHYRIDIQKSKVVDVQLESDRSGCYE